MKLTPLVTIRHAMRDLVCGCLTLGYLVSGCRAPAPAAPLFPWPPPAASAREVLTAELRQQRTSLKSLGDAEATLRAALEANGYYERAYYAVPGGFALVTRLEQIESDGAPKQAQERWSAAPPRILGIPEYLHALFSANPGYYRVIVFIITDQPFKETSGHPDREETSEWLSGGLNVLPRGVAAVPYTRNTECTTLIYEFERDAGTKEARILDPSPLDAHMNLVKSGIWRSLGGGT